MTERWTLDKLNKFLDSTGTTQRLQDILRKQLKDAEEFKKLVRNTDNREIQIILPKYLKDRK